MPVCPRDGAPATDPDAGDVSMLGKMVGEYVVKGVIGEGLQPVIGKRVAIKLLRREIAHDPTEAQRLLTEARAVNAIGHRGIIDIFGFGALPDGRQYFVMEYLSGQPLSRYIRDFAPLPVDDALKLLDEMLAAVGAAHDAGAIHRDIKPSNIFLVAQPDGSHFVKVLDFGLAKQAAYARGETPQTRISRVLGTPEYMAPEQARAEAVGPKTDLYALGCVLFEMLTGEPPFDAPTPFEIVNKHLNEAVQLPSSVSSVVPAEVDDLELWLMQKDSADRPESAELVRAEVRRLRKQLKDASTRLVNQVSSMTGYQQPVLPKSQGSLEVTKTEPEGQPDSGATPAPPTRLAQRPSDTKLEPLDPLSDAGAQQTRVLPPSAKRPATGARAGLSPNTLEQTVSELEPTASDVATLPRGNRGLGLGGAVVGVLVLVAIAALVFKPKEPGLVPEPPAPAVVIPASATPPVEPVKPAVVEPPPPADPVTPPVQPAAPPVPPVAVETPRPADERPRAAKPDALTSR